MYLFCDVDGVLIPFPAPDGSIPRTHHVHWVPFTGQDELVRIWLNPAHGLMLATLIADTGLEPVWCSTWRADAAPQIGTRLGLPDWPTVRLPSPPTDTSHPGGYLWKRDHLEHHAKGAPLAWIDDDFTASDHAWARTRNHTVPTLLIEPDPYLGLQPGHLEAIGVWSPVRRHVMKASA
jgi:hypothetical protein